MQYFTPEELHPSEQTLNIIRQLARAYRVDRRTGEIDHLCLN
jgi:hypothetical protein